MKKKYTTEEIEAYLDGTLKPDEKAQFEEQLKTDDALASSLELHQEVDNALSDSKALDLQKLTSQIGSQYFTDKQADTPFVRLPFYRRPIAIAASIALLVACGFLWWMVNSSATLSTEELFATYYTPYTFSTTNRGEGESTTAYDQAIQAYTQKDVGEASRLFSLYLQDNPTDMRASFGLGTTYLEQNPPALEAAAQQFQLVIDDGESLLVEKAKWYLALIRLKQEDTASTKTLLQELLNAEDAQLTRQAEDLLEKMR